MASTLHLAQILSSALLCMQPVSDGSPCVASGMRSQSGGAGGGEAQIEPAREEAAAPTRSLLTAPLYLDDEPPECRTLEVLHLAHGEDAGRTREEALALASRLREEIRDASSFRALTAEYSSAPNAGFGGVLGTFPPGVLGKEYERFLWSADLGTVSPPVEREGAVLLLRRGERWAGCRLILSAGDDAEERAQSIRARLEAGESFAELAREESDHAPSAARGGSYSVFERGPQDRLLKRAVFESSVGDLIGPMYTPLGHVVAQRIPPDELEPGLWESSWARVRALLISHAQAPGPVELNARTFSEARELAENLVRRHREEDVDLATLAAELDDDLDGRRRAGDLGWIRRDCPTTREVVMQVFQAPRGSLVGPLPLEIGYLLLLREEA